MAEEHKDMYSIYKIIMKVMSIRSKRNFPKQISKILSENLSDIVKIHTIRKDFRNTVYENPEEYEKKTRHFKLRLGSIYLDIELKKNSDMDKFFLLEPVLQLSYRSVQYIDRLRKYGIWLEALNKIREHFLANISHELRSPLVPLKGYLYMLEKDPVILKNKEINESIKDMKTSYRRLEQIINSLLEYKEVSIESLFIEEVNLREVFTDLLNEKKKEIKAKEINLEFHDNDFKDIVIQGDKDKIKIAFFHILDNSIKFNKKKGAIKIRAKKKGESILLFVEDTGIGMKSDILNSIFGTFYQGDFGTTRRYDGAGIGLSLAKKIILLHKGKIKIKSLLDKGTIVFIKLKEDFHQERGI